MKIPRYDSGRQMGANMTPMIDVVFLLIIFFLVSSHLARRENELQLDLPTATSGEEPPPQALARVTLNVLPNGRMELAGNKVSLDEIGTRLVNARARAGQDLELRIRSDRAVPYEAVAPVLAKAALSGIWNVTFAVVQQPGPSP